jgi:hypothetical protein
VTDVGPTFAKVTLISDASSTVVGQLLSSGATGEVVGQAGGVLVMRNVDSSVQIGLDEEVFTAGIELGGGIRSPYPKSLLLGTVDDVQRDANDVVQTAFLAPAANLDSFELALVITDQRAAAAGGRAAVPCGTWDHPGGRGALLHAARAHRDPRPRPARKPGRSASPGERRRWRRSRPCYALRR